MYKKVLLTAAIAATSALPTLAMADFSANAGWVSEYIYRGVYQEDSSAFGGFDYEDENGIYAGVWGADVGVGLEADLYFGYGGTVGDDFGYSVGWTGYYYTEDGAPDSPEPGFYDTITEINLGISYGIFALEHAIGEEDGWGSPVDYTFTSIVISPEVGPYYSYNTFGDEYDGAYIEVGYGFSVMDLDLSLALMYGLDIGDYDNVILLSEDVSHSDAAITFGVSKSFAIGE